MTVVYESFRDLPLDLPREEDGDDRIVPGGHGVTFDPPEMRVMSLFHPRELASIGSALVVPYPGDIRLGTRSLGVVAVKRALSRAGYGDWIGLRFTRLQGVFGVRNLKMFQSEIPVGGSVGVYNRATHQALAPFFDAYSIAYLLNHVAPPVDPQAEKRNAHMAQLMYLYNQRLRLPYTQRRPYDVRRPPLDGLDCSAAGGWAAKWAGLPEPSGYPSFGYGNTDTMIARYRRLGRGVASPEDGDPRFYGSDGDPSHVAYSVGAGRVFSFGHYPCGIYDYDYRHDGIGWFALL